MNGLQLGGAEEDVSDPTPAADPEGSINIFDLQYIIEFAEIMLILFHFLFFAMKNNSSTQFVFEIFNDCYLSFRLEDFVRSP